METEGLIRTVLLWRSVRLFGPSISTTAKPVPRKLGSIPRMAPLKAGPIAGSRFDCDASVDFPMSLSAHNCLALFLGIIHPPKLLKGIPNHIAYSYNGQPKRGTFEPSLIYFPSEIIASKGADYDKGDQSSISH